MRTIREVAAVTLAAAAVVLTPGVARAVARITTYLHDTDVTGRPVRILHGGATTTSRSPRAGRTSSGSSARVAYDAAATADAQKQVRELVTSVLLAPR